MSVFCTVMVGHLVNCACATHPPCNATDVAFRYTSVDGELNMQLTTLYFFCNRPTIGALMGIGTDLSAALARKPVRARQKPAVHQAAELGACRHLSCQVMPCSLRPLVDKRMCMLCLRWLELRVATCCAVP